MSSLKKKLGLYDFGGGNSAARSDPADVVKSRGVFSVEEVLPDASPGAGVADTPANAGKLESALPPLRFGDLKFSALAPGVYRYRTRTPKVELGQSRLRHHLPLRLSGILELALWPQPEALHPEDVLFLDTETTGLTRGTGTLPFLTGLACFESNQLVRELVLLSEPGGEEAYLDYIQKYFRRFQYLVSYNGRAFDVPLLKNRLILNRKPGLPEFLHFDLLHIFRRLYPKGSLSGYRQMDLEQHVLQYTREGDTPGAEIPQIYFDYVKYGHDGGMAGICEHNLTDLSGMVLLFLEAIRIYDERDSARGALRSGLARILQRNRRGEEAVQMLVEALQTVEAESESEDDQVGSLRYRDFLLLGQLQRRCGRFAEAAAVFEEVTRRYDCPYARMALAKLLEHRLKDFPGALAQTDELIGRLEAQSAANDEQDAGPALPGSHIYSAGELQRRRDRILLKQARAVG